MVVSRLKPAPWTKPGCIQIMWCWQKCGKCKLHDKIFQSLFLVASIVTSTQRVINIHRMCNLMVMQSSSWGDLMSYQITNWTWLLSHTSTQSYVSSVCDLQYHDIGNFKASWLENTFLHPIIHIISGQALYSAPDPWSGAWKCCRYVWNLRLYYIYVVPCKTLICLIYSVYLFSGKHGFRAFFFFLAFDIT